jgi:hypothetical protein
MGSWQNTDNLYLKYGNTKTTSENWGEYRMPGGTRVIEGLIDISTLSTIVSSSANILSDNLVFPNLQTSTGSPNSNTWFIEKVETVAETAISSTVATVSVGLIQDDRVTTPTSYSSALIATLVSSDGMTQGAVKTLSAGVTGAGNLVGQLSTLGAAASTGPYYITGSCTVAGTTGKLRVRIHYRGIGTITQ